MKKVDSKKAFLNSVYRGLADVESGKVYTTEELKEVLKKIRNRRIRDCDVFRANLKP